MKFADADLIGYPVQVVVGKRGSRGGDRGPEAAGDRGAVAGAAGRGGLGPRSTCSRRALGWPSWQRASKARTACVDFVKLHPRGGGRDAARRPPDLGPGPRSTSTGLWVRDEFATEEAGRGRLPRRSASAPIEGWDDPRLARRMNAPRPLEHPGRAAPGALSTRRFREGSAILNVVQLAELRPEVGSRPLFLSKGGRARWKRRRWSGPCRGVGLRARGCRVPAANAGRRILRVRRRPDADGLDLDTIARAGRDAVAPAGRRGVRARPVRARGVVARASSGRSSGRGTSSGAWGTGEGEDDASPSTAGTRHRARWSAADAEGDRDRRRRRRAARPLRRRRVGAHGRRLGCRVEGEHDDECQR